MDRIEFLLLGLKLIPHLKLIEVHAFIASNTFKPGQFFIFPKVVILLNQVKAITVLEKRRRKVYLPETIMRGKSGLFQSLICR